MTRVTSVIRSVSIKSADVDFSLSAVDSGLRGPVEYDWPPPPVFTVAPSITTDGTPAIGETITGADGTVTGGAVTSRAWLRDGAPISGATGSSYVLVEGDADALISFRVSASGGGGDTIATSAAVGPIAAPLETLTFGSTAPDTSTSSSSNVQFVPYQTTKAGRLTEFSGRFEGTGTGEIHIAKIQPGTKTVELLQKIPVTIGSVGVNTFALDVQVPAGAFIGYKRLTGFNVRFVAGGRNFSVPSGSLVNVGNTGPYTALTANLAMSFTVEQLVDGGAANLPGPLGIGDDWNHSPTYGQSNSIGADATPLISTTPSATALTFNVSTRMTKPSLGAGASDDGLTKALVEDTVVPFAGTNGETSLSSFAAQFTTRFTGTDPIWFASAPGRGGLGITEIDPFTTVYENLIYHVTAAKAAADAGTLDYRVPLVLFDHGESDQAASVSKASYKLQLVNLIERFKWETAELTGQTRQPYWLFTVSPWNIVTSAGATEAILEVCAERGDCWLVGPGYRFPQVNATHLSAAGQVLKGVYQARAAVALANGTTPPRMTWVSASASGTSFTAIIRGPSAAAFNTTIIGAATNNGIRIVDNTGDLTLSSLAVGTAVEVSSGVWETPITCTLNRSLGANPRFRYARDYLGSGLSITNGASGNVFDTTSETVTISGTDYVLAHAAPPVELVIS